MKFNDLIGLKPLAKAKSISCTSRRMKTHTRCQKNKQAQFVLQNASLRIMQAAALFVLLLASGLLQISAFVAPVPAVNALVRSVQQATDAADPFRPARASVDPLVINTLQKVLFRDTDVELALAEAARSRYAIAITAQFGFEACSTSSRQ
jgi:ABC-type transport system substrate-binding protein